MATILVIDDQADDRGLLRHILEADGHDVIEAEDGKHAVSLFGTTDVDLVIADIFMPEMDGIEFLTWVLGTSSDVPVIAVSGGGAAGKEAVLRDARALGAVEALTKPLSSEGVLAALHRILPDT